MFVIANRPLNSRGLTMFPSRFAFKSSPFLIGDAIDDVSAVIVGDGDIDVFMCDTSV